MTKFVRCTNTFNESLLHLGKTYQVEREDENYYWLVGVTGTWYRSQFETVSEERTDDPVNYPAHYTDGAIECIDAMQAALTPEEFRGFLKGQIFKYTWRLGKKDDALQDLGKALRYGERLKKVLEAK